ncbi:molybdopterin-dependent oxidoreductase-like protein [Alkalibaculum bacchi]|uniref:Molybdopterin-dependent oxidoreductase-like protein n=1 Tax=Alkalibaculum bacchi TaxID=645887 RepID=A0A366I1L4_9FIRM|nr:molybdopterin-dependent oxidoreductase [Alkalibaculum bacchi]RBP59673.1 molybdopterin-dependent oxidoreductase-like protein [Alkalibaculum bacchi]
MKKKILSLIMIALLGFMLVACSSEQEKTSTEAEKPADTGAQTETETEGQEPTFTIAIEAGEESIEITEKNIGEIKEINLTAMIISKKGEETNEYTGMLLKDVLAYANVGEYTSLELEAIDGYVVEYTKEMAESDGTILAYIVDGEVLGEEAGPIQSLIDGDPAKNSVKQLAKIRVIK